MGVQRGVQYVFRAANERLRTRLEGLTYRGRQPVICECSDPDCMEVLDLTHEEYTLLRDKGHFVVLRGHDTPAVESVVESRDDYDIVDKF